MGSKSSARRSSFAVVVVVAPGNGSSVPDGDGEGNSPSTCGFLCDVGVWKSFDLCFLFEVNSVDRMMLALVLSRLLLSRLFMMELRRTWS